MSWTSISGCGNGGSSSSRSQIGDTPVVSNRLAQADIETGMAALQEVLDHGKLLFAASSDIWQAVDVDGDGVAERMGRWLTNGVIGSEPTGLIFDPNTKRAILAVQHPSSGNDALWQVTLGNRRGNQ